VKVKSCSMGLSMHMNCCPASENVAISMR